MSSFVVPINFLAGRESVGTDSEGWVFDQVSEDGSERQFRATVTFTRPFAIPPVVHIGIVGFDIGHRDSARLRAEIQNVSATGFDIVLVTWLHTRVWRTEVSWLALGA
jgi:hypothetical protein